MSPTARDCVSRACELENERATEEGVVVERQNYAAGVRGGCGDAATEESKKLQRIPQSTRFSPMAEGFAAGVKTFESMPSMVCWEDEIFSGNPPRGESTGELGVDCQASSTLWRLGDVSTKPGPGFKFVQVI